MPTSSSSPDLETPQVRTVLEHGTLEIIGRLTDASNVTLLAEVTHQGLSLPCIYKPIRGERPLWDFPDSPLAHRELAAYLVAEASGWGCVPPTVLRGGPYGDGMVQRWIGELPAGFDGTDEDGNDDGAGADGAPDTEDPGIRADGNGADDNTFDDDAERDDADFDEDVDEVFADHEMVALLPASKVPSGWLPVFRALDTDGTVLAVCHADEPALAVIAGFDVVVNNADRKAPHLLPAGDLVYGVDHGLTFHTDDKLRTILWGWAGAALPEAVTDGLERLRQWVPQADDLDELLSRRERRRLVQRIEWLTVAGVYPDPPEDRTPIPWPPL